MRIGIHGQANLFGPNAIDELTSAAQSAEREGLAYWLPQGFAVDSLTALAVVGERTSTVGLGTFVVPTYSRHPMVMAMQALTAQAATGGRFTLGVGLSHRPVIERAFGL